LLERLQAGGDPRPPELFTVRVSDRRAPALARLLEQGQRLTLAELCLDPTRPDQGPMLEPLLLRREEDDWLLPGAETELRLGDRLLLAGHAGSGRRLRILLDNENILSRRLTGRDSGHGWLWRQWLRLSGQDQRG
jgi:voltage-gated potassium channel